MDQDTSWYGHCFRWEPSSPPLKGHSLQFSVSVRCRQTAGWIKITLGMGASQATFCSIGTQIPQKKGHTHPTQFLAHVYCG